MSARLWSPSKKRAVWLMHSNVEQAVQQLALPPGLFRYEADGPYLFGRPCLVTEAAQVVGTVGDIILADPKAILTATKENAGSPGRQPDCWFDLHMAAFRFAMRVGATPWWSSAVTQKNGGQTVSSAVALAAR